LQGFEAINAVNGWAIAVLGATIVFSGLVVLSLAISQLKKIVDFVEKRQQRGQKKDGLKDDAIITPEDFVLPAIFPEDIHETALLYKPLFEKLGETFNLPELYKLSQEKKYPHPHLTIKQLRQAQILLPAGDGSFKWHLLPPA